MGGKVLERISSTKILGVIISSDFSWANHMQYICPKASQRVYSLRMLRRAGISSTDMLNVYKSTIRASVEYACPAWHTGLTVEQSDSLEAIQKRAMKIIYPDRTYPEALGAAGLEHMDAHRERLAQSSFLQLLSPHHKLNHLLPEPHIIEYGLRRVNIYPLPTVRTLRAKRTLINHGLFHWQWLLGQREPSLIMDFSTGSDS